MVRSPAAVCGMIALAALAFSGCHRPTTVRKNYNLGHPLTVTIESYPPGADVYGLTNGSQGTHLGKTPLTLTYNPTADGLEGPAIDEVLEANAYEQTYPAEYLFKCLLVKSGYEPYTIRELLAFTSPSLKMLALNGRHRTYRAKLTPLCTPYPRFKESVLP